MKNIFLVSFLLGLGVQSMANTVVVPRDLSANRKSIFESLPTCDQGVFTNEQYLAVSSKLNNQQSQVQVILLSSPDKRFTFSTQDRVVDLKVDKQIVYVLTETTFQAWDINLRRNIFISKSHPQASSQLNDRQKATGFIVKNNKAIITHGTLGFSIIDLSSTLFFKILPMPTVSSAQDIDIINDSSAVVAVDNDNEDQFRGLYTFDLNKFEVVKQTKIDNPYPSAIRVLDSHRLMVIYYNAIWKFDLAASISASEAQPNRRTWKFPNLYMVDIVGKVAFDQNNLYACFNTTDPQSGARKLVPLAFDLVNLKLN